MPQMKEGSRGTIILDDRYLPMIVSTFIGEIDRPVAEWYVAQLARLVATEYELGHLPVTISDASRVTRSTPEMRRCWAQLSVHHMQGIQNKTAASAVVINNPVTRGIFTAISWLNPQMRPHKVYPSVEIAIKQSLQALDEAGTPAIAPLGHYRLPREAAHLTPLAV